jgi:hypothetical protein
VRWCWLVLCLVAAACAQQRQAEADATFRKEEARCFEAHTAEAGNFVARESCLAPARRAHSAASGVPSDLTELVIANRAVIASQVDRGELSAAEASARNAELNSNLTDRMLRRRNAALAAMPPRQPYIPQPYIPLQQAPVYTPPPPQRFQTTCQRVGQFTYCN